jgi:hypothetical protein
MTKQSGDETTIPTNDKAKPAQNKSEVVKDELSDTELDKAAGGSSGGDRPSKTG